MGYIKVSVEAVKLRRYSLRGQGSLVRYAWMCVSQPGQLGRKERQHSVFSSGREQARVLMSKKPNLDLGSMLSARKHRGVAHTGAAVDSSLPAYARIEERLARLITSGELKPGDRLPPERALAAQIGVSRMTLRQALGRLEDSGLLLRRHGRGHGTFVAEPKIHYSLSHFDSLYAQLTGQEKTPTSRVVRKERIKADRPIASALGIKVGRNVYRVVRLRQAAGVPLVLATSMFPAYAVPDLLNQDLEHSSIYAYMEEQGVRPIRSVSSLEAVAARAYEARLLGIRAGSPVVLLEETVWSSDGRIVEFAREIYRGDRSRFVAEVDSRRGRGDGGTTLNQTARWLA